ncbi:MAG: amino acid permease, partial [Pseudomonadota bacterium]
MLLATAVPLRGLAEATSQITLTIFALVNVSLLAIKWRGEPAPANVFVVAPWIPVAGLLSCLAFLVAGFL